VLSGTIPPVLRRLVVILGLAATGVLLASCGNSSHPAVATTTHTVATTGAHASSKTGKRAGTVGPLTKAQAIAFARAVNLTAADVPGFKATSRHEREHETPAERRFERELTRCTGESLSSPSELAEESSKDFKLEHEILHFSVSSEVSVARTPALAAGELAAIRSNHVRKCLSHYLDLLLKYQILKEQASPAIIDPNSISLSISHGTPPAPGATGSFGWRITATVAVHNVRLPFYIDILGFVYGPAEISLSSSGALHPFPAAIQEHLYLLLLKRAEAHRV
jgi:hypothetical protein